MKTPRFWYRRAGLLSILLRPLGVIYARGTASRLRRGRPHDAGIATICIGNLTAGGAGKTPVVMALQIMLHEAGFAPHVLSKGYGGSETGPLEVDFPIHGADQVGDEPLLLSAFGPVWVARDRVAGAKAAVSAGADVLILDDGFQDPSLAKDLSLVVVDARAGFGNGQIIPAGPLREPVRTGLARADAIVLVGNDAQRASFKDRHQIALPVLDAVVRPLETGMDWTDQRVIAFAGIAHPQKFFATLHDLGAQIVGTHSFEDHAVFSPEILRRLAAEAEAQGAQLVTTEKDAVRLPKEYQRQVLTLPVRLDFIDPDEVKQRVIAAVQGKNAAR